MQQLETSKQILEEEQKYKRECKGRSLALTRNVYHLVNTDVFYVESESSNNTYYFVKFKPDVIEWCTCPDNSIRGGGQMKCKHLHAIEFAIRFSTLKDTDKLPATDAKRDTLVLVVSPTAPKQIVIEAKSYTEDEYSF